MTNKSKVKKKKIVLELTRSDILKMAAAALGSMIAAPLLTTGPLSPFGQFKQQQLEGEPQTGGETTGEHHWGMLINLDLCIGCEYCVRACTATNDVLSTSPWNVVLTDKTSGGNAFFLSRPCLHCQNAPCVEVCPVKATYHREDGLVAMDYDRCIGCRYCQVACPYDARQFNWEERTDVNPYVPAWGEPEVDRRPRGVIEKCTFCVHRIDAGIAKGLVPGEDREATPACVNICPVGARTFGNLKDPNSNISQLIESNPTLRLRDDLGTDTSVYYIPPKEGM